MAGETYYNPLDTLLAQMTKSQEAAKAANLKRETEIRAIMDEIIARYQPGGALQKSALAQLETQKVSDVGAGMSRLISSGMAGTEAAAALETGWEKAVGDPSRLKLEDLMMERLSAAQMGKAGFLEGIEDSYPDYSLLASLAGQIGSAPTQMGSASTYTPRYDSGGSTPGTPITQLPGRSQWTASPATGATGTAPTPGEIYASGAGARAIKMGEPIMGASTVPITVYFGGSKLDYPDAPATKVINVPSSALGSGPGGFKDEKTYLSFVPKGYSPNKPK